MRRDNRFSPAIEQLSLRIAPSSITPAPLIEVADSNVPQTGHSSPIILDPVPPGPPVVIVA